MSDASAPLAAIRAQLAVLESGDAAAAPAAVEAIRAAAQRLTVRTAEDRRKAVEIAVHAATLFIQIAIAGVVAAGAFLQFATAQHWGPAGSILLMLSAVLGIGSMILGFMVISSAYRRGDGRLAPDEVPWDTDALKRWINAQALSGLGAVALFACAVVFAGTAAPRAPVRLEIPAQGVVLELTGPTVELAGSWTELSISDGGKPRVIMAPQ